MGSGLGRHFPGSTHDLGQVLTLNSYDPCFHLTCPYELHILAMVKYLRSCNYSEVTNITTREEQERFSRGLIRFRRATISGSLFNMLHSFDLAEFSMPQVFTLLLLDEHGERPIKEIAEQIGRSISTTSRLLDQLVEKGLISRREDAADRRSKRVAITRNGRELIATIEQQRAIVQMTLLDHLTPDERAIVIHAMELLAEASSRGKKEHEQQAKTNTASE